MTRLAVGACQQAYSWLPQPADQQAADQGTPGAQLLQQLGICSYLPGLNWSE
jgi:hypothetical protein